MGWRQDCQSVDPGCEGGFRARYHTHKYTTAYLNQLNDGFDSGNHMEIIELGDEARPTQLVRIAEHADAPDIEHPPILFVASLHAHEWIASEVALGYVDYLVKGANSGDAAIVGPDGLLEKAEFWFVVHGNVSGRIYDDMVDTDCGAADCQPGNPDHKLNGQRKNMQWLFGTEEDAETYSDGADFSGFCDYDGSDQDSDSEVWETGGWEDGSYKRWSEVGINVEDNFSGVWPAWFSDKYQRTAMLAHLVPGSATDYDAAGEIAPELVPCLIDNDCATIFSDHQHCVKRGTDFSTGIAVDVYGCFMEGARNTLAACQALESGATDELGINHVCLETLIDPDPDGNPATADADYDYLLWECGTSGDPRDTVGNTRWGFAGAPLSVCEDGVLTSCRTDAQCQDSDPNIDDVDFATSSVHRLGQRYCRWEDEDHDGVADEGSHYCAVSKHRTPCSDSYRGQRPFESIEARLLRAVGDNIPFAFMVDMHSSRNDLSVSCKGMGNGCDDGVGVALNEEYARVRSLRVEMIDAYNTAVQANWALHSRAAMPGFLNMVADQIDRPGGAGSQYPVWMSTSPAATFQDNGVTRASFDNGTYRGVTSFLWELGMMNKERYNGEVAGKAGEAIYSKLMDCDQTLGYSGKGSAPRSSLMLENQLAGMKGMVEYLASQAGTPNVAPATGFMLPYRQDVSLGGLRIHDGHGRGVQQLEIRTDRIEDDATAVTTIPAGYWAVEVDVLPGADSTAAPSSMSTDVALRQIEVMSSSGIGAGLTPAAETVAFTDLAPGEREEVQRRFDFESGKTYRLEAQVSGGDSCVAIGTNTCATANDLLVAKAKVVSCNDTDAIPNGLDPDAFCAQGLPFDDTDFRCNLDTGKCEECWLGWGDDDQFCEGDGFCFEGMCDDATTCWSGAMVDMYEAGVGTKEGSPTITAGDPPLVRTLHKGAGNEVDVDSFLATAISGSIGPTMYYLHLDVRNLCEDDKYLIGNISVPSSGVMEELEVRVQAQSLLSYGGPPGWDNVTTSDDDGWVPIDRQSGLNVAIPNPFSSGLNNGRELRIQVRNLAPDFESIAYSLDIDLSDDGLPPLDFDVKVRPWQEVVGPTEIVEVDVTVGDLVSIAPVNDAIDGGYTLFFKPAAGYEEMVLKDQVRLVLVTPDGQVPTNDNGAPIAQTEPKDGGLAIPLGALLPEMGPYEIRLGTVSGRVEGSVYLCSPNVDSCAVISHEHDPAILTSMTHPVG